MDAVDVVSLHHVDQHGEGVVDRRRVARIEPEVLAVFSHDARAASTLAWSGDGGRLGLGHTHAVRVEPHVQFQPALMRLVHGELERVVNRLGRLPHRAGEVPDHGSSFDAYRASASAAPGRSPRSDSARRTCRGSRPARSFCCSRRQARASTASRCSRPSPPTRREIRAAPAAGFGVSFSASVGLPTRVMPLRNSALRMRASTFL